MPTEILMPALSPTMEEGTLAKWLVKEGDTVASGDLLAEIETDKATMEFEAVDDGIVGKILVAEGSEAVKVNTPIAVLLEDGESAGDIAKPTAAPAAVPAAAAIETTAPAANPAPQAVKTTPQVADGKRIFASPLARRIAADKGLDLGQLAGSGPHGRIVKADVEAATGAPSAVAATATALVTAAPAGPTAEAVMNIYGDREYQEIKLDGMRKIIAARLTEAKQTIPHFYLRREIRIDALLQFRATLNEQLEARGVKLSVNDFIIKACALALQQVPAANAVGPVIGSCNWSPRMWPSPLPSRAAYSRRC